MRLNQIIIINNFFFLLLFNILKGKTWELKKKVRKKNVVGILNCSSAMSPNTVNAIIYRLSNSRTNKKKREKKRRCLNYYITYYFTRIA